jgi:hypothetical protein
MLHTSGTFSSLVIGLANVSTSSKILDRIQTLTEAPFVGRELLKRLGADLQECVVVPLS